MNSNSYFDSLDAQQDDEYPGEWITYEHIRGLSDTSYDITERLRKTVFSPEQEKTLQRKFSVSEAAEMAGRSTTAIRDAEKAGYLKEPLKDRRGRRYGYSLPDVNAMRAHFGTLPWRGKREAPLTLVVQNFKGGVGKSTISVHLAHYLALKGYRVCMVDCDPQGTSTSLFGLNPDLDLEEEDTLYPFLNNEMDSLNGVIRHTYWENIDLIPANLALANTEHQLAARVAGNASVLDRLRRGINTIKHDYDVVIIDPLPSLGMLALSCLRAANAIIIPTRPSTIDFSATGHYLEMLADSLETLHNYGLKGGFKFVKLLVNGLDESKSVHTEITKMMRQAYGTWMLNTGLRDSAEIDNASARLMSVYELPQATSSRDTYRRCMAYLDAVTNEIEIEIRKTWKSHHLSLRAAGLI